MPVAVASTSAEPAVDYVRHMLKFRNENDGRERVNCFLTELSVFGIPQPNTSVALLSPHT